MTYVEACWKTLRREFQLEIKLINASIEPSFPAESDLILKERSMAITKVLRLIGIRPRNQRGIGWKRFISTVGILKDAHETMKPDGKMSDTYRFDDCKDHRSLDQVAG